MELGFNNDKYLKEQSEYILERVSKYDKLYIEFGGKLFNDTHAKRVLRGYDENIKVELLKNLKDDLEVIICIYCEDIENDRMRNDLGINYVQDTLNLICKLKSNNIKINNLVITRCENKLGNKTKEFINTIDKMNSNFNYDIKVFCNKNIKNYPHDVNYVVSKNGFGQNNYIPTEKKIVVVTGSGANSGKLTTCLSQIYHEQLYGVKVGYSKFETFPVWDLPLNHPLNIAYESATLDIDDRNMVDIFHKKHYGKETINYNRDIEAFPILKSLLNKLNIGDIYNSPTDMGVNRISTGIINDDIVKEDSIKEIYRRCNDIFEKYKKGNTTKEMYNRAKKVLSKIKPNEYLSWDEYFMNIAMLTSLRSKDENTKVGACIVDQDNKIVSTGYNGFVVGCNNDDFPMARDGDWLNTKYPYIVHAEANSIFNTHGSNLNNCTIYVTLFPCNECTKAIIQSGIKHIVYLEDKYIGDDSNIASKRILDKVGVKYEQYQGNTIIGNLPRKSC